MLIEQITSLQQSVSEGFENQPARANVLTTSIQEAHSGALKIDISTTVVAWAAGNTNSGAHQIKPAPDELASLSARLNRLIIRFVFGASRLIDSFG